MVGLEEKFLKSLNNPTGSTCSLLEPRSQRSIPTLTFTCSFLPVWWWGAKWPIQKLWGLKGEARGGDNREAWLSTAPVHCVNETLRATARLPLHRCQEWLWPGHNTTLEMSTFSPDEQMSLLLDQHRHSSNVESHVVRMSEQVHALPESLCGTEYWSRNIFRPFKDCLQHPESHSWDEWGHYS